MKSLLSKPEKKLKCVRDELYQEMAKLQVAGRAHTPAEMKRYESLSKVIEKLDEALALLGKTGAPAAAGALSMDDGSYSGSANDMRIELRRDLTLNRVISADLFVKDADNSIRLLASLRTEPGALLRPDQTMFSIICEDTDENTTTGNLEMLARNNSAADISITLEDLLSPPAGPKVIKCSVQKSSSFYREIVFELEKEEKLADLPVIDLDGEKISFEACYGKAGIKMNRLNKVDAIPTPPNGWDMSQLHGLMMNFSDTPLDRPMWSIHLLLLSRASEDGLLGIMFDCFDMDENNLPRQGAAIFTEQMHDHFAGFEQKVLQTAVHELGHAFNLVHPFEREVGRADSLSFMNYDWKYKKGKHTKEYWENFKYTFSREEILFLCHAPWNKIVPGGVDFHTVKYWSEGTGGYAPYIPEVYISDLSLNLTAPQSEALFAFGHPVFLGITLKNESSGTINFPSFLLDVKGGFLEIFIRRTDGKNKETVRFQPIVIKDYNLVSEQYKALKPGESWINNIQLTFGSAGFTFAEPGSYQVTALLCFYDDQNGRELIVKSPPIDIRIAYPHSPEEEKEAIQLLSPGVGFYFALGGSDMLTDTENLLEEIRRRHLDKGKAVVDPLAAYITRCRAINLSRDFIKYSAGKFIQRKAQNKEAASLLAQLEKTGSRFFDQSTWQSTQALYRMVKGK